MNIDTTLALNNFNAKDLKVDKSTKDDAALKEQTDNFEGIFLKMLLDKALKSENHILPKSPGEDIYKSMYNDALSKEMSGSFGFSKMLFDFLKQNS
jgi:Rod binding domain-containing protein